jgi:ferredoxin
MKYGFVIDNRKCIGCHACTVAGDLSDASSEAAQLIAREPVRVRKPEQGTRPKLYYIDGDESAIVPTAARIDLHVGATKSVSARRRSLSG